MTGLSVITLTLNEEHNIVECLESVKWADERIVIDSGSIDKTVELAKPLASKVVSVRWQGYGTMRNLGLDQASGEWVFWLDADERVPQGLAEEIQKVIRANDPRFAGYSVARRAYFLGKWIRHCGWYPSRITRLFRRGMGRFSKNRVHEQLLINGRVRLLRHDLIHYTDPDLFHYFRKFNSYTSLSAEDMMAEKREFSLFQLLARPPFLFFKMYVLRLGFLDGIHGLILCIASSAYVFAKYAKLWELQKK
ncbi:MAG: glycosyltransferase family 2 protein [Ignavibacteria bacterium]|nr:glycosyltransferase family 2 protein [Ignavibacteria bacterium]